MGRIFRYETTVQPDWIDYNGHMQDAFYGLIFSYAVDSMQDAVGFDEAYRKATGCTIYLLEDHKYYLKEVKEGDQIEVETRVLNSDEKRFHLHLTMLSGGQVAAECEFMELHVQQNPTPHAVPIPDHIQERLKKVETGATELPDSSRRSRQILM